MYSNKQQNHIIKDRKKLNLPKLYWKIEGHPNDYKQVDRIFDNIVGDFRYNWYFKNVMFFDPEYNLAYFFDRILLTRRSLIFIKHQQIKSQVKGNLSDQYWNVKVNTRSPKTITNPIVRQQFMINRIINILNVRLFLKTATWNVVLVSESKNLDVKYDRKNASNIKLFDLKYDNNLQGIIDTLLKEDAQSKDIFLDETILNIYQALSSHAGYNKHSDKDLAMYGLYHRI
ncbi:hypothetical protein [Spiroplasma endosymbiont of Amphibalanus improvisus]|uniref:hypothetical protein n=1 Tax=Spiroplasma endosymbiont of Amphibalanus improvisus TaxID=3066327 RepID=UPI00313DAA9C